MRYLTKIESDVKQHYGLDYWKENKKEILKIADRHGNLDYAPVRYNSDTKRAMTRHPENFSLKDLEKAGVFEPKHETWVEVKGRHRGELKRTVIRGELGRFIRWLVGWGDLDNYD